MIVLDTSAVMALLLDEAEADRVAITLSSAERLVMSAGTLAECRNRCGSPGDFRKKWEHC